MRGNVQVIDHSLTDIGLDERRITHIVRETSTDHHNRNRMSETTDRSGATRRWVCPLLTTAMVREGGRRKCTGGGRRSGTAQYPIPNAGKKTMVHL